MPTSLQMKFKVTDDTAVTINFPYAKAEATPTEVKALGDAIISNNEIYMEPPTAIKGASFIARTVTPIELPE